MFDDFDTMIQSDELFVTEYEDWMKFIPNYFEMEVLNAPID